MTEGAKPCPVCGEEVKSVAKKCIHRGEFIAPRAGFRGWWQASWAEITEVRTLWDFVSLLIVPLALAGVGVMFSLFEAERQNAIEYRLATAQAKGLAPNVDPCEPGVKRPKTSLFERVADMA